MKQPKGKRLKDFVIKQKVIISEYKQKWKLDDSVYQNITTDFGYVLEDASGWTCQGGFKTKKQLLKALEKEL